MQFFADSDRGELGEDNTVSRGPQDKDQEGLEAEMINSKKQQKAAAWVWVLVGLGAALIAAVALVTAVLAYRVLQQRRSAKAAPPAAGAAEGAGAVAPTGERLSTASHWGSTGLPMGPPTPPTGEAIEQLQGHPTAPLHPSKPPASAPQKA